MTTKLHLTTFLILATIMTTFGQFLKTEGTAITNENGDTIILRGMGLGGWMLQEGYMLQTSAFANAQFQIRGKIEELIGETSTDEFYDAWLKNHVTRADIDSMAAWGFNSVRLPMHYNLYTLPIEDEPVSGEHTWLTRGFEMTDTLIEWCKANEMYVILDLHAAPGGQGQAIEISDRDPSKPSLWQSPKNWDKTVALWKRLAERYKDEPWVGAYDLLNEPNWDLPNGTALRKLYEEITDSIRAIDDEHILIIEGNWFANDFTGLTPPWDDNMAYGPHKYWSYNNPSDIEFATRLLDFDVPVYFGESGENSNAWFRDAIKLFEDNGIGWAWWPEKKIESIAGLMSIEKTPEYQTLLDYWTDGGTKPDAAFAKATLMELAENLKIENCFIQRDVFDAMLRQPNDDTAKPFKNLEVPGKVYAADFDMGRPGVAYEDSGVATYHVNTGSFTAWNNGWAYRNDGVDIEPTTDGQNTLGFSVGWIDKEEWIQYSLNVMQEGVYDIKIRTASAGSTGKFHLEIDGGAVTDEVDAPNTGAWDAWETTTISGVVLTEGINEMSFVSDGTGINLSSFEFTRTGDASSVSANYVSAVTLDENTVQLNLNKPMTDPMTSFRNDFAMRVNSAPITILSASIHPDNARVLIFDVNHTFKVSDNIRMDYSGSSLVSTDGSNLQNFTSIPVLNTISPKIPIPGRMQAEDFSSQTGIVLETTTDTGGGQNIGFLAPGDFCDYDVQVSTGGTFRVRYRTASQNNGGSLNLQLVEADGSVKTLHAANFNATGGWQDWETSRDFFATIPQGNQVLRLDMTDSEFNINWVEFDLVTSVEEADAAGAFSVYPNPSDGLFLIENLKNFDINKIEVYDVLGRLVKFENGDEFSGTIDLSAQVDGAYFMKISTESGELFSQRLLKE